jgi:hypothetical protein
MMQTIHLIIDGSPVEFSELMRALANLEARIEASGDAAAQAAFGAVSEMFARGRILEGEDEGRVSLEEMRRRFDEWQRAYVAKFHTPAANPDGLAVKGDEDAGRERLANILEGKKKGPVQ